LVSGGGWGCGVVEGFGGDILFFKFFVLMCGVV